MKSRVAPGFAVLLALVPLSVGCGGGGGGGAASGRAVLTIQWPDRSRLIPAASNSIHVAFLQNSTTIAEQLVPRPASGNSTTVTFNDLKVGGLTLSATAYPNADGTGTAQATGTTPVTIISGQTAQVTVTMQSTIDHLEITPATPSALVGASTPLTMTAKDASGAIVLTWPSKITWSSANAAYASVDTSGNVTAVKPTGATPGPVNITVTETESGKSATVPFAATTNTTISISTAPPTLSVGDTQQFAATVTNAPDTTVDWSVQEGATGGTITSGGLYTAPAKAGTFHVVATSHYDNSKTASVVVTVQSGGAGVTIQ